MPLDNNHPSDITIVDDLQIKKIQEISHKIDIVDQTVKAINIETIIHDQTLKKTFQTNIPYHRYKTNYYWNTIYHQTYPYF